MTIRNTSWYRTSHVRELVAFAARAMLVDGWDLDVRVMAAGVAFKGEFFAGRISIGIGKADQFPTGWRAYVRGAPLVFQFDWQEGIVATAAHEFTHARQAMEFGRFDEVEAERAARAVLVIFRGERPRCS